MRVIHKNTRSLRTLADKFQPAFNRLELRHARRNRLQFQPVRERQTSRRQSIERLKLANQGQIHCGFLTAPIQEQALPGRFRHQFFDFQIGAAPSDRNQIESRIFRGFFKKQPLVAVSIHHGRTSFWRELSKKSQLGSAILIHGVVIIEVILGEIGKGHRREGNGVESMLRETMRRRLHGRVCDALFRQGLQRRVNGDGIRCCVPEINMSARPNSP